MIQNSKDLFARQTHRWANCPDWLPAIIMVKICGTIWAKMEMEPGVRQDRCEGYTDDWAAIAAASRSQTSSQTTPRSAHQSQTPSDWVVVAAELQSQPSSQATQRPAHRIQSPSSRRIGTRWGCRIVKTIRRTLICLLISTRGQHFGFSNFLILLRRGQMVHRS